jgi:hypothetical protein
MEEFRYDGKLQTDFDLKIKEIACSPDDQGQPIEGAVFWNLENNGKFRLYAGCENEALEIEAQCIRPQQ